MQHSSDPWVRDGLELYQEIAFGQWLPTAIEDHSSSASQALQKLAELVERQHSDPWLKDFLDASTPDAEPATRAFQSAFIANQNDLHYEALRESRKAATLFAERHNLPGELVSRFQEIYALQRIPSPEDCLARLDELEPRVKQTNYHWLQGQIALERATCANLVSDFVTAANNVELSTRLARQFGLDELELRVIGLDASMKRQQKEYDKAWKQSVAGLGRYWQHTYSPERLYQFYTVMRLCAKDTGSIDAAGALLRRSIEILKENAPDDNLLKATLQLRLANILIEQKRDGPAEEAANEAHRLLAKVGSDEPTIRQYQARAQIDLAGFELKRGKPDLALSTIKPVRDVLASQDNFLSLDFYKIEGNARLQKHEFHEAASAYRDGILVAERALAQLKEDETRLPWIRATNEIYRGIAEVLLARKQDKEALELWEWSRARSFDRNRSSLPTIIHINGEVKLSGLSLPAVAQPHLIFASFQNFLQVWTVRESSVESTRISVSSSDLVNLVQKFNEACANPDSDPQKTSNEAQELYSLILQPVVAGLSPSEIIAVELDDSLSKLIIEALKSPQGQYFGQDYAVVYSPGILAEKTLRRPWPLQRSDSFTIADGSSSSGPGFLPGHEMATNAIMQALSRPEVLTGRDATLAKIKQWLARSAAFHFTGHGKQNGTGMALQLSPNLFLRAQDLSPEVLKKVRLAVLAACQSGSAENGLLDADNLVRSFMAAGVPAVVASHWNVDSRSTGELMRSFYLHLATEPAAQALRDARREMHLTKDHPYYWAAFSLTGRIS